MEKHYEDSSEKNIWNKVNKIMRLVEKGMLKETKTIIAAQDQAMLTKTSRKLYMEKTPLRRLFVVQMKQWQIFKIPHASSEGVYKDEKW